MTSNGMFDTLSDHHSVSPKDISPFEIEIEVLNSKLESGSFTISKPSRDLNHQHHRQHHRHQYSVQENQAYYQHLSQFRFPKHINRSNSYKSIHHVDPRCQVSPTASFNNSCASSPLQSPTHRLEHRRSFARSGGSISDDSIFSEAPRYSSVYSNENCPIVTPSRKLVFTDGPNDDYSIKQDDIESAIILQKEPPVIDLDIVNLPLTPRITNNKSGISFKLYGALLAGDDIIIEDDVDQESFPIETVETQLGSPLQFQDGSVDEGTVDMLSFLREGMTSDDYNRQMIDENYDENQLKDPMWLKP